MNKLKLKTVPNQQKRKNWKLFFVIGELLSKRINNIDKIIASKMTEGEINDKKGESNNQKIDEQKHVNNEVQTMFYVFSIGVLVKLTLFFCCNPG
jgi:hypothetical protein